MRSAADGVSNAGLSNESGKETNQTLQAASSGVLDTLKGRWSTLMASVHTNIEETIQEAASHIPFAQSIFPQPARPISETLSQRTTNVPCHSSPLKKQKTEEPVAGGLQQPTSYACLGVTGEKLTWSGAGSVTSACNCLFMLKQVMANGVIIIPLPRC
jgi:hypothetical protein